MASSYILELVRWNVKNDGTDAVNTSIGINNALAWASQQGFTEVLLPKGTYLIDETNPIQPQSFMTINLGGSTLRIRDNGLTGYAIISFRNNQQYARITNGKIEGDRYSHNYSSGGTHEFGIGVDLRYGGQFITIDNLEICNTTGDAIIAITSFGGIGGGYPKIAGNLEVGGINTSNGTLNSSTNRIRSKVKLPMVSQIVNIGYFGLYGDSYGGIGSEITTDIYDVIFYKSDNSYLSSVTNVHFFDEVAVPSGASYAKVVLHQGTVPSISGCTILVRTPQFPKHIYIEKCNLHHCRRLGIAICGAKHFYVQGCEIHHISGTGPAGAIDIEDGYDLNQYIYIDSNNIFDNDSYSIIAVAGRYINITNNKIHSGIFTINSGVNKSIIDNNYFLHSGPRLEGTSLFLNNHLLNSKLLLLGKAEALIENCLFHNSPLSIGKQKAYVAQINNCKFYYDDDFYNASINPGAPLGFGVEPQTISNSTFEGSGKEAFTVVPVGAHDWIFNNVSFINIKHRDNRITPLPPGIYHSCNFINSGRLRETSSTIQSKFEFENCYFQWNSYPLFYMRSSNKVDLFRVKNCNFSGGISGNAFLLDGIWGRLEFIDNDFYFSPPSNNAIIEIWKTTTADSVLIARNSFISTTSMVAISAENSSTIPLIFKDNTVEMAQIKLHDLHVKINNNLDGIVDPYYLMSTEPSSGFYKLGQEIKNANPKAGGYLGWVCLTTGYANNNPWKANKSYTINNYINTNGKVYKCINSGTSSTSPPTHTSGTGIDGSVTWEYVGILATFKPYGMISN